MTRMISTIIAAAMLSGLAIAPASAGGYVSIRYQPADTQQAHTLQRGLRLYGLYKGIKSGGITQKGTGNAAGIAQNGGGNFGVVHQKGSGHSGTVEQNGSGNAYGLFQFGKNTSGHAVQNGNGQAGATFQFGW